MCVRYSNWHSKQVTMPLLGGLANGIYWAMGLTYQDIDRRFLDSIYIHLVVNIWRNILGTSKVTYRDILKKKQSQNIMCTCNYKGQNSKLMTCSSSPAARILEFRFLLWHVKNIFSKIISAKLFLSWIVAKRFNKCVVSNS